MNIYISDYVNILYEQFPQLFSPFQIKKSDAINGMKETYKYMNKIMRRKYPKNHPFMHNPIDGCTTMFAYLLFVIPTYLHNNDIMEDFLRRKLACKNKDGLLDVKKFNENYSELEIFTYLFIGIFCNSNLHKSFTHLQYETCGQSNKKYEYSFCFHDYNINVEVKALTCAPEITDNINLFTMKHGDKFYKHYFPHHKADIPTDYLNEGTELKSNYRQLCNNINKIKQKCTNKEHNINLGFIMINYGTSREEYISYLLHSKYGYLNLIDLGHVDGIILFSMCTATDLLMTQILNKDHILTYPNPSKNNSLLFHSLRLDNYITDKKYTYYRNHDYGLYKGINYDHQVTIQPAYDDSEIDWSEINALKKYDEMMQQIQPPSIII